MNNWSAFKWALVQVAVFLFVSGLIVALMPITLESLALGYFLIMVTWIFYRIGRDG